MITKPDNRQCTALPVTEGEKGLLILTACFPPDSFVGAARPYRFWRYLPRFGYSPTVVTMRHTEGPETAGVIRVPVNGNGPLAERFLSYAMAKIQRYILPYNEELAWVPHAAKQAKAILRLRPMRAVLSTSPPVATHLAALWLKMTLGVKWVADFRDPISGNPFRIRKHTRSYNSAMQHLIIKHADAVIVVTDTVRDDWVRRYPWAGDKFHLIWNGFDPEGGLQPVPIPPRSQKLLLHLGSIYGGRHPLAALASLDRLIRRGAVNPQTLRVILTVDVDTSCLRLNEPPASTLLAKGCLECNGDVPRDGALRATAEADYLLLLDTNSRDSGYTVPAKLFEYVAVGRPILAITAHGSPVDRILSGGEVPHACLYVGDTPEQHDAEVLRFLSLPPEPHAANLWFRNTFDGSQQTGILASLLDSLH